MVGFAHDDGFPEGGKKVVEFVYPWQEWQKVWMSEEKKKYVVTGKRGPQWQKMAIPAVKLNDQ